MRPSRKLMLLWSAGRSNVVLMSAGIPNVAGSTELTPVLKSTMGLAFCPPTDPRTSVCFWKRMLVPNRRLCRPFNQLRLSTNWYVSMVRRLPALKSAGCVMEPKLNVGCLGSLLGF